MLWHQFDRLVNFVAAAVVESRMNEYSSRASMSLAKRDRHAAKILQLENEWVWFCWAFVFIRSRTGFLLTFSEIPEQDSRSERGIILLWKYNSLLLLASIWIISTRLLARCLTSWRRAVTWLITQWKRVALCWLTVSTTTRKHDKSELRPDYLCWWEKLKVKSRRVYTDAYTCWRL